MTITSVAPVLSSTGITAPTYDDILDYLKTLYRGIYGADIYLENDSQDGQFLAIIAKGYSDTNSACIAVYNAFSPATAVGTGLSSGVKLNGITRAVPTNSTAPVRVIGVAGTAILSGLLQDPAKNTWALPATVNIPLAGQITVTATCQTVGAVAAATGTINRIISPQLGWQSASNTGPAVPGAPVESDATLRARQAVSVMPPAQSQLVGVIGAVAAVPGVTRYTGYENPLGAPDANGLPAHSLAIVVEGGNLATIAQAIANKKGIGPQTYGTTTQVVADLYGILETINFFVVTPSRVTVALSIHPTNGYTSAVGDLIKSSIAAYINALGIGTPVIWSRMFGPATLNGSVTGQTYEVTVLQIALYPGTPGIADLPILFNAAAACVVGDITLTLV